MYNFASNVTICLAMHIMKKIIIGDNHLIVPLHCQLIIFQIPTYSILAYLCTKIWKGTEVLNQRSLAYITSQQDNNTYYTDGSSDGMRGASAIVRKEEEIIIRLNDSASNLHDEMTAIQIALKKPVEIEIY